jgi:ubiquinone/menaquinone biosynthesis C-methylase UbiE
MSGYQLSGDAPSLYARFAGKVIGSFTDELIQAGAPQDGDRVLDVACGTGLVAARVRLASQKLCAVTGIDINEGMLGVARNNSEVEWRQGSATALPFADGSFDLVLCQQGLQYFPDRPSAVQQMARVLVPGGRLAVSVWGAYERQPFHVALIEEIGKYMGADAKAPFDLAFSLNTAEELRQLAAGAKLTDIRVRFTHRTMRHAAPGELIAGFAATTPIAGQFLAMPADRQRAFVGSILERLSGYIDDGGLAVPQENHYLTALKPA